LKECSLPEKEAGLTGWSLYRHAIFRSSSSYTRGE
jgi:hypothetical protein